MATRCVPTTSNIRKFRASAATAWQQKISGQRWLPASKRSQDSHQSTKEKALKTEAIMDVTEAHGGIALLDQGISGSFTGTLTAPLCIAIRWMVMSASGGAFPTGTARAVCIATGRADGSLNLASLRMAR
jgi:hypothetical protein